MESTAVSRAIEDAIKGGYEPFLSVKTADALINVGKKYVCDGRTMAKRPLADIFLDKAFWVALGKARNWDENLNRRSYHSTSWIEVWHRLIDALAEGKTPEQFFLSLEGNEV